MKRSLWLIPAVLVLLWFSLKDVTYRSIMAGKALPDAIPATYLGTDGWALLPIEEPPGAWTDPWGIDLFIVPPPSGTSAGKGIVGASYSQANEEITEISHQIEKVLSVAGPSYSPIYRHPSAIKPTKAEDWDVARDDVAMAFEQYLYSKNKWRGILIVAAPETEQLLGPLLQRIEADPRLVERFSGVVLLSDTSSAFAEVKCSPVMEGNCVVQADIKRESSYLNWLLPQPHRSPVSFEILDRAALGKTLIDRNTSLSLWLDKHAPKPAEPLGGLEDMEVIDIAPVRRPGETDDVIAERELRAD